MNKDIIPENYSLGLAFFDAVPVVLFGIASVILWKIIGGPFILLGGLICFTSGMLKVLWKFIVVIKNKNVWPLFLQMRIGMPIGFLIIIIGLIAAEFRGTLSTFVVALFHPLPIFFLVLTGLGMAAMIICGSRLDSSDVKDNWIEQTFNTMAQGSFLITTLLCLSAI